MFEQSLYEHQPVTTPQQQGDLFYQYEIKSWSLSPRIYKILGLSVLANVFALFVFAQTSLLTMKGCDSPLVGRVCQVLDTVYVGSMLWGTDREYIDAAYDKTDLADADITFIDVSGMDTPPLSYPEGYFQLANGTDMAMIDQIGSDPSFTSGIPGIPSGIPISPSSGGSLLDTTPNVPTPNPGSVDGGLPPGFDDNVVSRVNRKSRKGSGTTTPTPGPDGDIPGFPGSGRVAETKPSPTPTPEPTVQPTDAVTAVTINREPLKVFGKTVAEKLDKKEVDLSTNFKVVAEATLTEDGKLDTSIDKKTRQKKSRILTAEGDPKMVTVVTDAIAAIGDSGWLGYLRGQGIDKINFTFSQTDEQLFVSITSEQLSPERAKTISSGLNGAISGALLLDRTGTKPLGDDEKTLLQAAAATFNGKQVVLNFMLPKPVAQEMMQRNIQRAREAETGKKSQVIEAPSNSRTGVR